MKPRNTHNLQKSVIVHNHFTNSCSYHRKDHSTENSNPFFLRYAELDFLTFTFHNQTTADLVAGWGVY